VDASLWSIFTIEILDDDLSELILKLEGSIDSIYENKIIQLKLIFE